MKVKEQEIAKSGVQLHMILLPTQECLSETGGGGMEMRREICMLVLSTEV